jgi:hypothetical protein
MYKGHLSRYSCPRTDRSLLIRASPPTPAAFVLHRGGPGKYTKFDKNYELGVMEDVRTFRKDGLKVLEILPFLGEWDDILTKVVQLERG